MLLHSFFRGDLHDTPARGIQELFRAILMRTNFVPVVRHIIGWRGVKQSVAEVECWSAKIHGQAGVYGISFHGLAPVSGWTRGRFRLHYFPHPDEDLVEKCSLQAAALTQAEDYLRRVRDFLLSPELADLFDIGSLFFAVDAAENALVLELKAQSSQRSISEAGVVLLRDGKEAVLIEPGGRDQDFPAFEVATSFFNVLASSVTFNLDQPPVYLGEHQNFSFMLVHERTGALRKVVGDDVLSRRLVLGYGTGRFEEINVRGPGDTPVHQWAADRSIPGSFEGRLWWKAHQLQSAESIDKKILGVDERPPLIILTGFLGSGKTSFLRHFIEYQTQRSRFVAVIQNEIGAVGLDGKLLDYTVTEIDEGCVCCSLAGSLNRAVKAILSDFTPDFIIVETTGLANPLNLLEEMEELEELVRFDCTLTVVDAVNVEKTLAEHPIAADQIRGADLLLLNKKDLVEPDHFTELTARLRTLNPHAPLFPTENGDLHPALILDADDRSPQAGSGQRSFLPHYSHQHEGLWAKSLQFSQPLGQEAFLEAVARLPPSIFRAKGIVEFSDSPQAMLFQYVGGRYELSAFPEASDKTRFLTLIGKGGDPDHAALAFLSLNSIHN
jgi:G3E family GTPase